MGKDSKFERIMEKLDEDDKAYLSKFVKIVNDRLARNILAKMASPHSPICYDNVPLEELGGDNKFRIMSLLNTMEQIGLAKSEMVKRPKGSFRQYHVTDEGKNLVCVQEECDGG